MIALSAVQSSARTRICNAILFIHIPNNARHNIAYSLTREPSLTIIANNETQHFFHMKRYINSSSDI